MPLRVLSLITLFIGAYSFVQSVLILIQDYEQQDLSMVVVIIFLLVTPFSFAASFFFAFGIHRIAADEGADQKIILGFAMMVMAAVDNLVYVSIHHEGDAISFYLLGGIELICFVICFLYYQGLGNRTMTLCGAILLTACTALELEEAVRYFISIGYYDFTGYYFSQTFLDVLIAVESLLFVFGLRQGIVRKKS